MRSIFLKTGSSLKENLPQTLIFLIGESSSEDLPKQDLPLRRIFLRWESSPEEDLPHKSISLKTGSSLEEQLPQRSNFLRAWATSSEPEQLPTRGIFVKTGGGFSSQENLPQSRIFHRGGSSIEEDLPRRRSSSVEDHINWYSVPVAVWPLTRKLLFGETWILK